MKKVSVMYIIKEYPQISQTYVKTEIEAIYDDYEVTIVSQKPSNVPHENHFPYRNLTKSDAVREFIEQVRPDVLHTHHLDQLKTVGPLAERMGLPFTIRAHSFDVIPLCQKNWQGRLRESIAKDTPQFQEVAKIRENLHWLNHELCLGALTFPFTRPFLEKEGIRAEKIVDCYPVVNYKSFYDRSANGNSIMNTGAVLPKKKMENYITLASRLTEREFNLYALGYDLDKLKFLNNAKGSPVNIIPPVEPDRMLPEYKKHQWLVYTAAFDMATVGWPMAVAEAQASGVGVCMPNIRPDLKDYIGEGGLLYDSIDEVADMIAKPVCHKMREAGFLQAKKSDIQEHKHLLTDLWDKSVRRQPSNIYGSLDEDEIISVDDSFGTRIT